MAVNKLINLVCRVNDLIHTLVMFLQPNFTAGTDIVTYRTETLILNPINVLK
jgi:hypothetical protein